MASGPAQAIYGADDQRGATMTTALATILDKLRQAEAAANRAPGSVHLNAPATAENVLWAVQR